MTFDDFVAAHAGEDFESYSAFVAAMDAAGLEGADRQKAYQAWRLGWSKLSHGGGAELVGLQRGRIKQWR